MSDTLAGTVAASAMLSFYLACGYVAACCLLIRERWIIRLWIGGTLGLMALMWLPALFAFFFNFSIAAHLCALGSCALLTLALFLWRRPQLLPDHITGLPTMLSCVLPLTLFSFYLLWHHTLRPTENGALHTGQSGFGDMSMHLTFITSLARQGIFPPEYSIMPGVKLGYPFLCDSISASFYLLGAPLRLSYMLPSFVAMALCFLGYYLLMLQWLSSRKKAALAYCLFFVGGGFGFAYFFDIVRVNPWNFERMLTQFYQTPTNWTDVNLRWVNPVADMLLPQRATLYGWMLLLPCMYLLYRMTFQGGRNWVILGLLVGGMPMVHTHSFLVTGLFSAALLAYVLLVGKRRVGKTAFIWGAYGFITLALALPQLFMWTFPQSGGDQFLRPQINWINTMDNPIWFYVKNIGLVFLCVLPAAFAAPSRRRVFWICALPIWVLAELIVFQPNEYDNNKLLLPVHMLTCGLVAAFLIDLYRHLKNMRGRRLSAAMIVSTGILSGALTLWREAISDYELFSVEQVAAARFIDEMLPPDVLFLTGSQHNNAPAALAGRNILMGSSSYLYFHGVYDAQRDADRRAMMQVPGELARLADRYEITHVYLSSYEWAEGVNWEALSHLEVIYDRNGIMILAVNSAP